ncbi:hypothetical protein KY360_06795 [Candidatus Woesearchaeota archaeon]|nr:hypothetical protein [Candidatus Woesearchaeota archaeon]
MDRETQSRLIEFLLTYGWAVLVVFVALGALIFFGLFPKGTLIGPSCSIDSRIGCHKLDVTHDGNITLVLENNFGNDLTNVKLTIGNCSKSFSAWKSGTVLGGNFTKLIGCDVEKGVYKEELKVTYNCNECVSSGDLSKIVGWVTIS